MSRYEDYVIGTILVVLGVCVITLFGATAFFAVKATWPRAALPAPEALVKIEVPNGHGSGAHLGNGLILTAAHVVTGGEATVVTNQDRRLTAEVLWSSPKFDVALLRVSNDETFKAQKLTLDCTQMQVGEAVIAKGFPYDLGRFEGRGYVASITKNMKSAWPEVNIVDITVGPGMSGGPVVSQVTGKLRGMVNGLFGATQQFGPPPPSGVMFAVPSSTICTLLASGGA